MTSNFYDVTESAALCLVCSSLFVLSKMSTCRHIERARKRVEYLRQVFDDFYVSPFTRSQYMTTMFASYLNAKDFEYEVDFIGYITQFNVTCL